MAVTIQSDDDEAESFKLKTPVAGFSRPLQKIRTHICCNELTLLEGSQLCQLEEACFGYGKAVQKLSREMIAASVEYASTYSDQPICISPPGRSNLLVIASCKVHWFQCTRKYPSPPTFFKLNKAKNDREITKKRKETKNNTFLIGVGMSLPKFHV